jgi:hypothetical protein
LPVWLESERRQLRAAMTALTRAHKRWLKRLVTGKIPDHLWPIGVDGRGRLRTWEPGQSPPPIKIISEAEARKRTRRPLPLP